MFANLYCFRLVRLSVVTLTQSFLIQFTSKFHTWIASINLTFKFEYWFCPTSDNQDGRQNGRHLSIFTVVVRLTQSFLIRFLPNFINELPSSTLAFNFEYGFCLTSYNQDGRQNGRCLLMSVVAVHVTQSFFIEILPNCIHVYGLLSSNSHSSLNMSFVWRSITKMADKMAAAYQSLLSWSL